MSIKSFASPIISEYEDPLSQISGNTVPSNTNPEAGPSGFAHGTFLLDPRYQFTYNPGQDFGKQVSGWNATDVEVINQIPSAHSNSNIAAAQTATAGVALTLTAGTGVTGSTTITRADTGATVTGLLAIDSAMTTIKFGSAGTIDLWDPRVSIARNLVIVSNGNDTTGTFAVAGFDLYGFPMHETIAGTSASTANGKKAWKYIQTITPAGTLNSTGLTVGTGDVFGFPLRADDFGHVNVTYANVLATGASGTFTAAVTSTATATSGDVRGTYQLATASTGTSLLVIFQSITAANLGYFSSSGTVTGMLGVTQF